MATRKSAKRSTSRGNIQGKQELKRLAKKARAEIRVLIKRDRAGTLSQVELQETLAELDCQVLEIEAIASKVPIFNKI